MSTFRDLNLIGSALSHPMSLFQSNSSSRKCVKCRHVHPKKNTWCMKKMCKMMVDSASRCPYYKEEG